MNRGSGTYTPFELIFSIVIVSLSALALAMAFLEFRRSEAASRTTVALVSLDEALAHELVNLKYYQDESTKIALRTGRIPQTLMFKVPVSETGGLIEVRPNSVVTLDRAFHVCTTYPIGECGYKIRLTLEARPPGFSYEVSSAFPEAALSLSRGDRSEVLIPRAAYRDPYRVACDLRREVGLSGLVSSDRYDCLARPQKSCPRGALPKALVVDPQTHSLELDCGPPSRVARCPASYALSRVNTPSLDAGDKISAQCVRTTASVAAPPKQPAPAHRLVGRVCPQGYRSESTCSLVNIVSRPGRCGVGVARPVPGKVHFVQNNQPGSVDCGVDLREQSCGATWSAQAQLKIKCVLDQPEFAHAL